MLRIASIVRPGLAPTSFSLSDGECVALSGPSGSGKSLLLRAIADLDPNDGEAYLDDTPRSEMQAPEWRRQVTYLPAEPGWWAERAGDHFTDIAATEALAARLGLPDDVLKAPVSRLSTGERQRLALIRCLGVDPKFLLLDEPTAALDPESCKVVETLLEEVRQKGTGILWVTHDADQAKTVAARRFNMTKGELREVAA